MNLSFMCLTGLTAILFHQFITFKIYNFKNGDTRM